MRKTNEERLQQLDGEEKRLQELLKQTLGSELLEQTHQKLAKIDRHRRIIEYRQTKRRASNQAKIVVGAILMNLRAQHPGSQGVSWSELLAGLTHDKRIHTNQVLREFAKSLR